MLDSHAALGVAEIIFYAPILALALYLTFVRHGRPRMPWWFIFSFSCFRLATGIVTILYQKDRGNVGLIIAQIILLNVGVIPLLLCTIGFVRLIVGLDHAESENVRKAGIIVRAGFLVGIALLIAGGVLEGRYYDPPLMRKGVTLTKVGYILLACVLLTMTGFEAYFWANRKVLSRSSKICLSAITAAMPFQIVRIVYSLLSIFKGPGSIWYPLTGSLGVFIGMALLMEYVVVVMYVTTGFIIEPVSTKVPQKEFWKSARSRRRYENQ